MSEEMTAIRNLLVINEYLMSRQAMINRQAINPKGRDIDKECGYPFGEISPSVYWTLYETVGIANRIVNVYPSESWSVYPELYETEEERISPFEAAWHKLNRDNAVWSMLESIDELSGIGSFGVLYLGFGDNKDPLTPVDGVGDDGRPKGNRVENELLFMSTFDQTKVNITRFESDKRNPRYGQPLEYELSVVNPAALSAGAEARSQDTLRCHWSRVIHVADNRKSSKVLGMPRMRPVIPEIMDIRKIRGGSAEMFWRGAFPGYSFESLPELGMDVELDTESIKEEFEKYANGLQRYLALSGMTAKSLAPQIGDPTNHLEEQYRSIGATLGVPIRILMGSESGHLASTQDAGTWYRRIGKRQQIYLTPWLIRPFVGRMVMTGVLPPTEEPNEYTVSWNDLNTMTAADKADVALKKTQAMMSYVTGGCEQIMPLLEFYVGVLGLTINEASAILAKVKRKNRKTFTQPAAATTPAPQGGGRNFGDTQNDPGSPGTAPDGSPNV